MFYSCSPPTPFFLDLNSTAFPKATTWNLQTEPTPMKTTETRTQVTSHSRAQRSTQENHLCKVLKRTPSMWSRMKVSRADQKRKPGIRIQIETRCQTERSGEAVGRFTRMTMRTIPAQRTQPHLTLGPGLHRLRCKGTGGQRVCLATPLLRQVGCVFRWREEKAFMARWWQCRTDFSMATSTRTET